MKFRISEIPENKSVREVSYTIVEFSLQAYEHKDVSLLINFNKQPGTVLVDFEVRTEILLICDRSLDSFEYPAKASYKIIFKQGAVDQEDERQAIRPLNVSSNQIDISREVRDSLLLSIPIKKLHPRFLNEDGSETEFNAVFGDEPNSEDSNEVVDPRWDALKKLKNN
ncbi:MAG: DUF177 domain-containing protein [Balneolales bacterium]|nr:DUF177 domain-containing protein [Balneolales bacterium]